MRVEKYSRAGRLRMPGRSWMFRLRNTEPRVHVIYGKGAGGGIEGITLIEFKAGLKGIAAAGTGAFMVFGLLSAPAHAAPTAADKAADAAPAVTEAGEAADGEVGTLSHWPNPVNATNKKTVPGSSTTTSRGTMQLRRGVVDGQRMVWARAVNANSNLYIMLQFRRDDGSYGTSLPRRIGTRTTPMPPTPPTPSLAASGPASSPTRTTAGATATTPVRGSFAETSGIRSGPWPETACTPHACVSPDRGT